MSYDCRACGGKPWPCDQARAYLLATTPDPVQLSMRLWRELETAAAVLRHEPPALLFERFLKWARRDPANTATERGEIVSGEAWFESSYSGSSGHGVQARFLEAGGVAIRHSRDSGSAVLRYTQAEWDAFVQGVKDGEFDRRRP